jgi:hypothetical protein
VAHVRAFAPGQRRFGIVDIADALNTLMTEVLGHERYLVVAARARENPS